MDLKKTIYLIIKSDGSYYSIDRNNEYTNHYQYLREISKQNDYLKACSFGLIFERDNNLPNILFFKELVLDNCIIFENFQILSSEKVSAISVYLPYQISKEQGAILNSLMDQIDNIEDVFLEKYREETEDFYSICQNLEEIKSGNKILKKYIQEHLLQEKNIRK